MHLSIPVQACLRALTLAQARSGRWAQHVCLTAGPDGVQLESSDGLLALCVHLPEAHIWEEGQILLPSRQLQAALRPYALASGQSVEIRESLGGVTLLIADMRVKLTGEDPTPFPGMARHLAIPRSWRATVSAPALRSGQHQVLFAAAKERACPAFQGVLCQFDVPAPGQLTLVTCDQFRMAIHTIHSPAVNVDQDAGQCPQDEGEPDGQAAGPQLLIPATSLAALQRLLPRRRTVTIGAWPHGVLFQIEQLELFSCLLPETFPDYRAALPRTADMRARLEVEPFLRQLQAARAFARERANGVWLRFCSAAGGAQQQGQVSIMVGRPAASGEGEVDYTSTLETTVEGADLALLLNSEYLLEGLKRLPPTAVVDITGTVPFRPLVLTWCAPSSTLTSLVMPMVQDR
ncbi:DNA polymerase III subunit beta [Thermogemmatispora carboxidivorans]|uniref:DNA polymerase III subunit beta n=1 Tax=Thermogemmatispora carboxidivorans TaxID=1382306 RepID=UPI000699C592|nr:DNA polymerase III subunit beta [Thermogemmatispora carboxidivorans]